MVFEFFRRFKGHFTAVRAPINVFSGFLTTIKTEKTFFPSHRLSTIGYLTHNHLVTSQVPQPPERAKVLFEDEI